MELTPEQIIEQLIDFAREQLREGVIPSEIEQSLVHQGLHVEVAKMMMDKATLSALDDEASLEKAMADSIALGHWAQVHRYEVKLRAKNPFHLEALKAHILYIYQWHNNSDKVEEKLAIARAKREKPLDTVLYLQNLYNALSCILFSDLDDRKIASAKALIQDARGFDISLFAAESEKIVTVNKNYKAFFDSFNLDFILAPLPAPNPWPTVAFATSNGAPTTPSEVCVTAARLQSEMVFLVSADELYIQRYANTYISSTLKNYGNALVVVCVVGGLDPLQTIAATVGIEDERLIFFSDPLEISVSVPHHPRVYYQTARFRWVGYLLERIPLPIVTTDIDIMVQRNPQDLLQRFAECDIVLNEKRDSEQIQSRIIANLLLFNQTESAKLFARAIRSYIEAALNNHKAIDLYLDQTCLVMAQQQMRRVSTPRVSTPRFCRFGPFDINNLMYTKSNMQNYKELFKQFNFLALYASQDDVIHDKKWWLDDGTI